MDSLKAGTLFLPYLTQKNLKERFSKAEKLILRYTLGSCKKTCCNMHLFDDGTFVAFLNFI